MVDSRGRRWALDSYAEMALRTAAVRAGAVAHTEALKANGHDLVMISDAPEECHLCRPWEGKILSITTGRKGTAVDPDDQKYLAFVDVALEDAGGDVERVARRMGLDPDTAGDFIDRMVEESATGDFGSGAVIIAGNLNDAKQAGLFHPGCRHRTVAYFPRVTRQPTATADPEGDRQRQRQRHLEREIRRRRQRAAVALDPQARGRANAEVRSAQTRLRDFIADTGRKRLPARERILTPAAPPAPVLPATGDAPARPGFSTLSAADFNEFVGSHPGRRANSSPEVEEALNAYIGEDFAPINKALRAGRTPAGRSPVTGEAHVDTVGLLDQFLGNSRVGRDTTVYRGMSRAPADLVEGSTFTDRGFMSTSVVAGEAERFAGQRGLVWEIRVPADTRGSPIYSFSEAGTPEYEILLARNIDLRVVSYDRVGRRVVAEVIP